MRIGVDIDGVLFPWDQVARWSVRNQFGDDACPSETSTHWKGLKDELTKEQWRWVWGEGRGHVFGSLDCYPDAVWAVSDLIRMGHEVHFVTHRDPATTLHHTAGFLRYHFDGPWAGVHSVRSTTPKETLADWDVFIDDKPETILRFLELERTKVFAPRRTWNEAELDGVQGLVYYDDAREIVEWVEDHS